MKKRILTLIMLLVAATFAAQARPIDMTTAREVAIKFMNANVKVPLRGTEDLQLATTYNIDRGDAAFYVFNTPNGFVIVSADDCATPILGYSDEGQFDVENIPIQLQDILQGYVEQIQYGIENQVEDETIAQQWRLVITIGRLNENRGGEVVEPLITAMWNQGCYYNAMCPEDDNGPCDHCVTGCVATAMAQILHYWGYPGHGTGSHSYTPSIYPEQSVDFGTTTYDWENMPNSLNSSSSSEQINAVATLMWHCGVSLNMNYGPYGSGAPANAPLLAMKDYFDYSDDMHFEYRQDDESWMSSLKNDLDAGRPVYYVGCNVVEAHALVCDGYDVNDRFHFNYGWGGSSNGYFALNAIIYYDGNCAIFNIHPNTNISYQITASASPTDGGTVNGTGIYDIGSICTLTATANEGYAFMYWTEDDEVVSTRAEYSFCVRKDRELVAHFGTPFQIGIVVVPEEGGTVSGAGEYGYGSTCTLMATPNEGYDFICWRRPNGNVVTTAQICSFTVTEATTLTAVFAVSGGEQIVFADLNVKALCVANWDTNGDGELSYSEAAAVTDLGNVFRNKTTITSFEELQCFTGLTTIGNGAFWGCGNLSGSLYIPNSVTTIGNYAFYYCSGFTESLIISNSVTTIGEQAFYNCNGFTGSLTIPNSVTEIGNQAFYNCSGFTGNLTLGNSVTTIGNSAFQGCSGFTGDLYIPNSVNTIGYFAFYDCSGFTGSLTIGNSVTAIDSQVFRNCYGFTGDLIIGNSVTTIGYKAFEDCSGFTGSLIIPNSVTTIGTEAFRNCSGFTGNLTIGSSVVTIGESAFHNCSGFTGSLYIPDSVTTISSFAFHDCSGFTGDLIIGNSVVIIGNGVFNSCNGFTGNLSIGNSVTSIGSTAFAYCSSFTGNLTIPNSVTTIGSSAFFNCSGFTGLTIGNSVATIGNGAFSNCSGFTGSLTIPDSLVSIGNTAFFGCRGFTGNLTIPDSVTELGDHAFYDCSGFTGSLTIGNSVTSIGNYAFQNCRGFTGNLIIPNSVTSIGQWAFGWCQGFTGSLTIGNSVTSIGNSAFQNCSGFTGNLIIPNSVTSIGNQAFWNCSGFTGGLIIPNSVASIGNYAFRGCSGFTDCLTIGNSVITIGTYAFDYCRNFTSMIVHTETPPTVAENAFYSGLYGIPVHIPCGSLGAYQGASGWSSFTNYHEDCLQAQTIELAQGWNWFSTNLEITMEDLQDALVEALPGTSITIKSNGNGQTSYNGTTWMGALRALDVAQMYKISVSADCEIVLEGIPINPADHPVTIANGANWIGFPLSESMTVTNAFAGFPVTNDKIKSNSDGQATFNGTIWVGALRDLEPGKGYVYKSNASGNRTFTFPIGAK